MDTTDTTNPEPEAPELQEQEVETEEPELEPDGDGLEGEEQVEEDEELDVNGEPIRLPKAIAEKLKPHLMMDKDYTQKSQFNAEQRREIEQQRQALEIEQQTRQELFKEEAQLHGVRERLQQFQNVNWQQAWAQNPQEAGRLQSEYTQLKDYHDQLYGHVEGRKSELAQHREQATAIAMSKAVEMLNKPDPEKGWDGKFDGTKRQALTEFGLKLGFTNEELSRTSHPRMIQTLNLARIGYEAMMKQRQTPTRAVAQPAAKVPTSRTTVARDPSKMTMEQYSAARRSGKLK
jgi:hypothetical protein